MKTEHIDLRGTTPGTRHTVTVHRFGTPGARPQIYIQAALHADEIPGMITAHYLRKHLLQLEAAGRILGEIILVPFANPLGLAQRALGANIGRFDLKDGINFNRQFPDLLAQVPATIADGLTQDPDHNVALIRQALREAIRNLPLESAVQHLKIILLGLAVEADWVLDLHCDGEAVMHLYTLPALSAPFQPLSALLQAHVVLIADLSGDDPFDEACSRPWTELARRYPSFPIPLACRSTTVELRGQADVDPWLAETDAQAIVGFMVHADAIAGSRPELPTMRCTASPLEAVEPLSAPSAGIIVYHVKTGQLVTVGMLIAEIIDPASGEINSVRSSSSGVLFARSASRFATTGQRLGKIAGTVPRRSGKLLSP